MPGGRAMATMAVALIAASALFLGKGAWIIGKARIAQVLLARAWDATQTGSAEAREAGVKPWPWADTWPVARLTVPRLGIDEIVLAGGSGEAMAFGPALVQGGCAGNLVLAGHRDTHFRFLRDLAAGDEITLETPDGKARIYRVEGSEVVDFRDRRPLAPTPGPALTLVTCYPFDAVAPGGPLRFVVRAVPPRSP